MQFAPLYPWIYQILKPTFTSCLWSGEGSKKVIALTFDDGPHPRHTPQVLAALEQYQIKASFFWLGCCVENAPAIADQVYQAGHWIGLHGYHHQPFPLLSADDLQQSLLMTQQAIARACQIPFDDVQSHIRDVRPPIGLFTPTVLNRLHQWGYRPVMWSVVPEDWVRPGVDVVVRRTLRQVQNGSLIVLHDGYYGGDDVAAILHQLIPLLLRQGYQFITVDQLWQEHPYNYVDSPTA
jgi:peptidoglycan/xylan/chitin deacetylase (PgdA/CDA1 family)